MSKDNTELEEQLDRRRVSFGLWKIVSDMLDNPGEHGIYPTSECYDRLDEKAQALITEARNEGMALTELDRFDGLDERQIKILIDYHQSSLGQLKEKL